MQEDFAIFHVFLVSLPEEQVALVEKNRSLKMASCFAKIICKDTL